VLEYSTLPQSTTISRRLYPDDGSKTVRHIPGINVTAQNLPDKRVWRGTFGITISQFLKLYCDGLPATLAEVTETQGQS